MTAMKHCRHTPRGEKTRTEDKIELRDFDASDKESGQQYVSFCYPPRNFSKSYLSRELTTSYQLDMKHEEFIKFYGKPQSPYSIGMIKAPFANTEYVTLRGGYPYKSTDRAGWIVHNNADFSSLKNRAGKTIHLTISTKSNTASGQLMDSKNASTCGPKFSKERLSHYTAYFKNTRNSEDNYELADD